MPSTVDPAVVFNDVSFRRGETQILTGIHWQVEAGEQWCLIGPNGAGKSTILRIAGAMAHPSSGSVTILGGTLGRVNVFDLRPKIGVVSAATSALIPERESARNVVLTAQHGIYGRWREVYSVSDEAHADLLLDQLGVSSVAGHRFTTLSDGEKRRVQIARAMMTRPGLLLLDEPAAGLDLGAREGLLLRLEALAADAAAPTTVLVTHHLEELPSTTSHAAVVSDGRIIAAGPIRDVLTTAVVSRAYGMAIEVRTEDGRYSAVAHR